MSTRVPAEPVARGRSPRAPEREEADRGGGGDRGTGRDEPPRAARAHGLGSRMLPSPASLLGLEREVPSDPSYRDDVEEVELAVETLELVDPVIGEGDLLTRHRISDGSGDEDLAGLPDGHDAGPGVDGEAAHLGPHHLGLPEMDAARISRPSSRTSSLTSFAHRMASAGLWNTAKKPSQSVSSSRPR
jgi:hypothetical protein